MRDISGPLNRARPGTLEEGQVRVAENAMDRSRHLAGFVVDQRYLVPVAHQGLR